jgi:hypothetical protein
LSLESRFDLAYTAAHALALAALRWHGYRSHKRYLVFRCLKHTVDLPDTKWRVLNQAHRKRNLAEYEGYLDINENLGAALVRVTREVADRVASLGAPPSDKRKPASLRREGQTEAIRSMRTESVPQLPPSRDRS